VETINLDDVEAKEVEEGALRKVLLYSKNLMLVYYEIEPQRTFPMHSHSNEQIAFVIQGKGEFTVNGKKVLVEKGSAYIIKPGEPHGLKTLGNEKYIDIDVFYPPRKDFLPKKIT
jgi:quercetin dioxygenase-like cupin family protein